MSSSIHTSLLGPTLDLSYAYDDGNRSQSGLEHLVHAADLHQRRSLKLFHTLQRAAEVEAEKQLAIEERTLRRETRLAEIDEVNRQEALLRAQAAEMAHQRRAERFEAARQETERRRQAAQDTCNSVDDRANLFALEKELIAARNAERAAEEDARREAVYRANEAIAEQKRKHVMAKIDASMELQRQKEELHKVEMMVKEEEDYFQQQVRDATKRQAELNLEQKKSAFLAKSSEKEKTLKKRLKELAALREAKQREAQERFEFIELQAQEAAAKDSNERERLRRRLDDKKSRVESLCAEREALTEQLTRMRHSMSMQESIVRNSLDLLRRSGTSFSLPYNIARSLTDLGTSTYFPRASVALASGVLPGTSSAGAIKSASTTSPNAAALHRKRTRPLSAAAAALRASRGGDGLEGTAHAATNKGRVQQSKDGEGTATVDAARAAASRREDELRRVLREEIDKETERQAILSGTMDQTELARLQAIFAQEREESKRRIIALSTAVNAGSDPANRQMRPSGNQ